jgi:hypothetical protein
MIWGSWFSDLRARLTDLHSKLAIIFALTSSTYW